MIIYVQVDGMEAAARARRRPNLRGYSRSGSGAECPSKFAADVGWGFDKSSEVGAAARFSAAAGIWACTLGGGSR